MATGRHLTVAIVLPIVLVLLYTGSRKQEIPEFDGDLFEEPGTPALELLQREAKVIHMSRKPMERLSTAHAEKEAVKMASMTTAPPAAEGSAFGISANGVGNLPIFLTGIATDAVVCTICFFMIAASSRRYPLMFLGNTIKYGTTPLTVEQFQSGGFFNWAYASWSLTIDEIWKVAGLDHAMLIEYANLGFNTFKWIALPMFFIQGPLNCFFGGNAAGLDHESWFSMGNVEFFCWLYWPLALCTWWVTWCVTSALHNGMRKFMPLRFEWLVAMDKLRANTLMMTGIPAECQSDAECAKFFNKLLPGSVEAVHITKDSTLEGNLYRLISERTALQSQLSLAQAAWEKDGSAPDNRPTIKLSWTGSREDAIEHYKKEIAEKDPKIKQERQDIFEKAKTVGSPNLSSGFITFKERRDTETALRLDLSDNVNTWILDYPPQPMDVIWSDMTQDPRAEGGRHLLGYALTAGLVIIYMPLVVFICNVASMINMGPLQSIWSSEAPSLGLTIMVDFLPTILMMIFTNCFSLYDRGASQLKLSIWYWWMCVLYVVLITALGTNFMAFATTLAKDPLKIFSLMADTMPSCTHYYMNYIGMQAYSHGMVLTRYMPLFKYRNNCRHHTEQEAKDMAEPEDQDYYGIGSRTCRWSIMMCIGIVYGTLSPPCSVLTFCLFFVIRCVYGYLFVYAETVKSDLGGVFFVRALHNTFISLHIYFVLMLGVFCQRSPNWGPVLLVAMGWVYVFVSQKQFSEYKWERLPFPNLTSKVMHKIPAVKGTYVQPELCD